MKKKRPIAIDLFCGAGGMSLGFEQAGFDVALALDNDPTHLESYSANFPRCNTGRADISKIKGKDILSRAKLAKRDIHVLFGGPPCQGFSLIGKRRIDDPRNGLIYHFARLVRELKPLYFVMENVEGIVLGKASEILQSFLRRVKRTGYDVVDPIQLLDASNFGVPQRRRRVFVLGYQRGLVAPRYPEPTSVNNGNGKINSPCVWDAIGDLPIVDDFEELLTADVYYGQLGSASKYARILRGDRRDPEDRSRKRKRKSESLTGCSRTVHTPETIRRFSKTSPGSFEPISRFHRLTKEGLALTLRAGTGRSYGSFTAPRPIHPLYPRCITVREAARLHSLPDWFRFHPTKWHGFRQVGNSVPPLLARVVAQSIFQSLI